MVKNVVTKNKQLSFKVRKLFCLFLASFSFANVGGTFYDYSALGLKANFGTSIISAATKIKCVGKSCAFTTTYKIDDDSQTFKGRFYGRNFTNISVNGEIIDQKTFTIDSIIGDSSIFERTWVLENYSNQYTYAIISIHAQIRADSTFTISGELDQKSAINWGLAQLENMNSLRHPMLSRSLRETSIYSIAYCFAPIHQFQKLEEISFTISGDSVGLMSKKLVFPNQKDSVIHFENQPNSDSIVITKKFPDAIIYKYNSPRNPRNQATVKRSKINLGGPLAFVGTRSGSFHSEIGWEFAYSPTRIISILPSINSSFTVRGYQDSNFGLRIMSMGYSLGTLYRMGHGFEITGGLTFGVLGVEFRNKGVFLHLSI